LNLSIFDFSSWNLVSVIRYFVEMFLLTSISICFFFSVFRRGRRRVVENIERGQRYSCPRCCSSFSKKGNMLTHFRHECGKEPRFQCPYCGKKDRKSSNTYRHIRLYHKGSNIQAYRLYWIRKNALTIKLMCRAENKRNSLNQLSYEQPRSSLFRDLHLTSADQQMKREESV